jgi:type IV secretion system protein VirB10
MRRLAFFLLAATLLAGGQSSPDSNAPAQNAATQTADSQSQSATNSSIKQITVPAGTEVPLVLKSAIDTKNTRSGDGVYCQTVFPVMVGNVIAIPAGTYVKGEVVKAQRAGKIKGRAEVQLKFNTLIFPNGYTVDVPGTIHNDSGASNASVDDEGRIKADPQKGKDATTVAKGAGVGAAGGAIITGSRAGVLGGAGIGGLAGLATVLMTRGQDVRIEPGASIKMLLQRPLVVDIVPYDPNRTATDVVPHASNTNRLPTTTTPVIPKQ